MDDYVFTAPWDSLLQLFSSLFNSHIVNEVLTQQACLKQRNKVLCETIKQTLHHPQYQRTFNFDMNNMMNLLFFRHKGNFKLPVGRFQTDSLKTQSYSKSSIMQQQTESDVIV